MIIEYSYTYWGDNGSCYESKLEEFTSERDAIGHLGYIAYTTAMHEDVTVFRVIDGESFAAERIRTGIELEVARRKKEKSISVLKNEISMAERWFESIDQVTKEKLARLESNREALIKLEERNEIH